MGFQVLLCRYANGCLLILLLRLFVLLLPVGCYARCCHDATRWLLCDRSRWRYAAILLADPAELPVHSESLQDTGIIARILALRLPDGLRWVPRGIARAQGEPGLLCCEILI